MALSSSLLRIRRDTGVPPCGEDCWSQIIYIFTWTDRLLSSAEVESRTANCNLHILPTPGRDTPWALGRTAAGRYLQCDIKAQHWQLPLPNLASHCRLPSYPAVTSASLYPFLTASHTPTYHFQVPSGLSDTLPPFQRGRLSL